MTRKGIATTVVLIALLVITLGLSSVASAAVGYSRDVRYSGIRIMTIGVDTLEINNTALKSNGNEFDTLGTSMMIVGGESVSGERMGWIVGGFAGTGKLTGKAGKAELNISLAGASVERIIYDSGNLTYVAGVLAGVGNTRLELAISEQSPDDWNEALTTGCRNTVSSAFWFAQPSVAARMLLTDYFAVEARLGVGLSMTDGQWKQGQNNLPAVPYKVGGLTLTVGVKAGVF